MRHSLQHAALLGTLLLASALAHAQFAWIDEKGVRHYSDQPPPTNTPDAKILKAPRGMARPAASAETAAATPAAKPAATIAEREADYTRRHAKAAESDKKAASEQQLADAKRALCSAAAQNKAQLDTGRRVRTADNAVMPEADKARELANAEKVLKDCQ